VRRWDCGGRRGRGGIVEEDAAGVGEQKGDSVAAGIENERNLDEIGKAGARAQGGEHADQTAHAGKGVGLNEEWQEIPTLSGMVGIYPMVIGVLETDDRRHSFALPCRSFLRRSGGSASG